MSKVSFIVFIDEFGDDILARNPKKPYGFGFFVCRGNEEDIKELHQFNEELIKYIPQKIHLRKYKKDECHEIVKKVSSFLSNCKKEFYGGGNVYLNPSRRTEIREFYPDPKDCNRIKDNIEVFEILDQAVFIVTALSLKYKDCSEIEITLFYDVPGNFENFCKKAKKIEDEGYLKRRFELLDHQNLVLQNLGILPKKLPSYILKPFYIENKNTIHLHHLADVFAHITKRISCTKDQYSNELYQLLKPHFNLFDEFSKISMLQKGILKIDTQELIKRSNNKKEEIIDKIISMSETMLKNKIDNS